MISIIISSYKEDYFKKISENIQATCGVDYEIIKIDNKSKFSLCKAYNLGAQKAQFPCLLFLHEDIKFHTTNWGIILIEILKEHDIGIIGLSGSNYYANFPGSWWNTDKIYTNLIQRHPDNTQTKYISRNFLKNSNKEKVKALDGVFMACNKSVYEEFLFDEKMDGYHCYDLIFSLKVSLKYQNYITNQILIEHFSNGSINKDWITNILLVKNIIGNISNQKTVSKFEMKAIYGLILNFNRCNYDKKEAKKIILKYLSITDIGLINYFKVLNRLKYI